MSFWKKEYNMGAKFAEVAEPEEPVWPDLETVERHLLQGGVSFTNSAQSSRTGRPKRARNYGKGSDLSRSRNRRKGPRRAGILCLILKEDQAEKPSGY